MAKKKRSEDSRREIIYVSLPHWAAEALRKKVSEARSDDLDTTISSLVRRMVVAALKGAAQ